MSVCLCVGLNLGGRQYVQIKSQGLFEDNAEYNVVIVISRSGKVVVLWVQMHLQCDCGSLFLSQKCSN